MHSIDALFSVAVGGDDDERWVAVQQLAGVGGLEVFERAVQLCAGAEPRQRAAGAEILGQMSGFSRDAVSVLESMTGDADPDVVAAAVLALAQQREAVEPLVPLASHPDGKVRWALVTALEGAAGDERAERVLLRLMADEDVDVRDRATFAIGCLSETDTPRVRSALVERLGDENATVAREAALGLARRRDARAIAFIARAIENPGEEIEEAIDEITSPEMLVDLLKAKNEAGAPPGVDSLIARCRARL